MKKKLVSLLLSLAMILSLFPMATLAADTTTKTFSDVTNHWGKASIERWAGYGVLNGDDTGKFNPDNSMTRAEFSTMLVNLMGYKTVGANKFADVKSGDWYADAILKLAAAGIMKGDGTNANPNSPISRQEAAVLLCRVFGIEGGSSVSFTDKGSIASWAMDSVAALYSRNMIAGVGNNSFAPLDNINRASVAKMIDNMINTFVPSGTVEVSKSTDGIVLVAGGNVTIKDGVTVANLMVAPKASGSTITVEKNATVTTMDIAGANAAVKGEGAVKTMTVTGSGATVDKAVTVTKINNDSSSDIKYGDKTIKAGENSGTSTTDPSKPSGGSSGGGGGGGGGGISYLDVADQAALDAKLAAVTTGGTVNLKLKDFKADTTLATTTACTINLAGTVDGKLTVNAPNATINSVAKLGSVEITAVADHSFNIKGGAIGSVTLKGAGAVVVGSGTVSSIAVATDAPVILSGNLADKVSVTVASANVTLGNGSTNTTVTEIAVSGADTTLTTDAKATVSNVKATANVTLAGEGVEKVTVPSGTVTVIANAPVKALDTAVSITVDGTSEVAKVVPTATNLTITANSDAVKEVVMDVAKDGSTAPTVTVAGSGIVDKVTVTKEATVNANTTVATVEAKAPVVVSGADNKVQQVTVPAAATDVTVTVKASVPNVKVDAADTKVSVDTGKAVASVETSKTVIVGGAGTVSSVDVVGTADAKDKVTVKTEDTVTVSKVTADSSADKVTIEKGENTTITDETVAVKAPKPTGITFELSKTTANKAVFDFGETDATKLQYKIGTDGTYAAIPADKIIASGTVYIRVAAVTGVLASEPVIFNVPNTVGIDSVAIDGLTTAGKTQVALLGNTLMATYGPNNYTGGDPTYQWYSATASDGTTGAAVIEGATSDTYKLPTNSTIAYIFCKVTDTYGTEKSSEAYQVVSATANVASWSALEDALAASYVTKINVTDSFSIGKDLTINKPTTIAKEKAITVGSDTTAAAPATVTLTLNAAVTGEGTIIGLDEASQLKLLSKNLYNKMAAGTYNWKATGTEAAKWTKVEAATQYTVTFNTDGGSAVASQKVNKDATIATQPESKKDGFTLEGWYTDKQLTTKFVFGTDANATKVTSDITLYAKWTQATTSAQTVAVRPDGVAEGIEGTFKYQDAYTAAGVTFDPNTKIMTIDSTKVAAYVTNEANAAAVKAITHGDKLYMGLQFPTPTVDDGTITKVKVNDIATAFDLTKESTSENGDVFKTSDNKMVFIDYIAFANKGETPVLDSLSPVSYTFQWMDTEGNVLVTTMATITRTATTAAKYTVTFGLNNGTWAEGFTAPTEYTAGTALSLPVAANLIKEGFTFAGWYTKEDLTGNPVTEIAADATGSQTFYAKWTEKQAEPITTVKALQDALAAESATVTLGGNIDVTGDLTIGTGKTVVIPAGMKLDVYAATVSGEGTITVENGGTLHFNALKSKLPTAALNVIVNAGGTLTTTSTNTAASDVSQAGDTITLIGSADGARLKTAAQTTVTVTFQTTYSAASRPAMKIEGGATIPADRTFWAMFGPANKDANGNYDCVGLDMTVIGKLTVDGTLNMPSADGTGSSLTIAEDGSVLIGEQGTVNFAGKATLASNTGASSITGTSTSSKLILVKDNVVGSLKAGTYTWSQDNWSVPAPTT